MLILQQNGDLAKLRKGLSPFDWHEQGRLPGRSGFPQVFPKEVEIELMEMGMRGERAVLSEGS